MAFLWGGLGGLCVELVEYSKKLKNGEFDDVDSAYRKYYLIPCIVSSLAGGAVTSALSFATTPSEIWFFVIGITAGNFISNFIKK